MASAADDRRPAIAVTVEEIDGPPPEVLFAEFARAGSTRWTPLGEKTVLGPLDRLRTGAHTRGVLRWTDQSAFRFGPLTVLEIQDPYAPGAEPGLHLFQGIISFFHREKPARLRVVTRGANAGVDGTEFVLSVETVGNTERTTLSVIDGSVQFTNALGSRTVTNLRQAVAVVGQAPELTPGFINANNVLQWVLYYPAVLDLREIPFTPAEEQILAPSLAAYRAGDLHDAFAKYPAAVQPVSDARRIYSAALWLAVGQVPQAEILLAGLPAGDPTGRLQRLALAVRRLIAAVKLEPRIEGPEPILASEFMAASYYEQSRSVREESLRRALDLAQQATKISPGFGLAWARVADLEFSFGRVKKALEALNESLTLAPRNAPAYATRGFLLAAQNQISDAIGSFDEAIALDGAVGVAWLGRGLASIRRNHVQAGREDLLVAVTLEPQRAFFRSYLGKVYADEGDTVRATKELELARGLDPKDPTSWLYSALLHQQDNRINQAVRDLEKSQELNDNRRLYRSKLLLDQDRAVGSANLAGIYRDAGMEEISLQEAAVAVNADYANYSAHLFLANSYDQLRDPKQINLRYETASFSEYLIANLLAPVGAGILSQTISQQEYSKLFERERFGVASSTEYRSNGAWLQEGGQFGTFENGSYLVEGTYRSDRGERPNNDLEQTTLSLQLKQQLTPQDTVYLQVFGYNASGGDLVQRYNPSTLDRELRTSEQEHPLLLGGYHREWSPGVHTLFLAGWLNDSVSVKDPLQEAWFNGKYLGNTTYVSPFQVAQLYEQSIDIFTSELQQIWEGPVHSTIVGARFQAGDFHVRNLQYDPSDAFNFIDLGPPIIPTTLTQSSPSPVPAQVVAAAQNVTAGFDRISGYGYHFWNIADQLTLIGGLSYDTVTFPKNFRFAPISDQEQTVDRFSPKAGVIWEPFRQTTVRAAYSQSVGGASLDQSVRLEPTQVAGLNQAFRSIIPEALQGANAGALFETYGFSLEQKFRTGTYLSLSGEVLSSSVDRTRGIFDLNNGPPAVASGTPEELDYKEKSLVFTVNQLVGDMWSFGLRYRITDSTLRDHFPAIPPDAPGLESSIRGTLNQLDLHAICNTPIGLFAEFQALWNQQNNHGYGVDLRGDDFWQLNVFAGYRFPRRKAELLVGVLNITDQDYHLQPLNLYSELPHSRTFMARFRFNF